MDDNDEDGNEYGEEGDLDGIKVTTMGRKTKIITRNMKMTTRKDRSTDGHDDGRNTTTVAIKTMTARKKPEVISRERTSEDDGKKKTIDI